MRRAVPAWVFLVALTALAGYPGSGQEPSTAPSGRVPFPSTDPGVSPLATVRSPFGADPVFAHPLTLAVKEQSLGEWLDGLRKTERLPVRADPNTQDERVTLFCKARPAGEILAAVARHFDYTWVRRRHGDATEYFLTQTKEQQEREARLRAELWAFSVARLRKQVEDRLAVARLPVEERRERMVERLRQSAASPDNARSRARLERFIERVEQDRERISWSNGDWEHTEAACLAVPPADWERLWQGQAYRFSLRAGRTGTGISPEQASRLVRTVVEEQADLVNPEVFQRAPTDFVEVDRVDGEIGLQEREGSLALSVRVHYRARRESGWLSGHVDSAIDDHDVQLDRTPEPVLDPDDRALQQSVKVPPPSTPAEEWSQLGVADRVELLAQAIPRLLVADDYDPLRWAPAPPVGSQRLDRWLLAWCGKAGLRVRRDGDTLHFRRWDWARLRPLQVPDRLMRPWEADLRRYSAPRLRTLVDMAARLTDEQLRWARRRIAARPGIPRDALIILTEDFPHGGSQAQVLRVVATLTEEEWRRTVGRGGTGAPLTRRAPRRALIASFSGKPATQSRSFSTSDQAPKDDREDESAAELVRRGAPALLHGKTRPVTVHVGPGDVWDEDLKSALELAREFEPNVKAEDLRSVRLTSWSFEISVPSRPGSSLFPTGFRTAPDDDGRRWSSKSPR